MDENRLNEVWLLTCDYNCTICEERVFADMGDEEIACSLTRLTIVAKW